MKGYRCWGGSVPSALGSPESFQAETRHSRVRMILTYRFPKFSQPSSSYSPRVTSYKYEIVPFCPYVRRAGRKNTVRKMGREVRAGQLVPRPRSEYGTFDLPKQSDRDPRWLPVAVLPWDGRRFTRSDLPSMEEDRV